MAEDNNQNETSAGKVFFWLLWILGLALFPFYGFTFFIEASVVKEGDFGSHISPIVGLVVFISQITVAVISFKQIRQGLPLSNPYLTLLGGSIIIGFVWAGGCAVMGPFSL